MGKNLSSKQAGVFGRRPVSINLREYKNNYRKYVELKLKNFRS